MWFLNIFLYKGLARLLAFEASDGDFPAELVSVYRGIRSSKQFPRDTRHTLAPNAGRLNRLENWNYPTVATEYIQSPPPKEILRSGLDCFQKLDSRTRCDNICLSRYEHLYSHMLDPNSQNHPSSQQGVLLDGEIPDTQIIMVSGKTTDEQHRQTSANNGVNGVNAPANSPLNHLEELSKVGSK